ncbi:hypothetical protein TFLX_01286 [Thermoflexales bacterium]|nr:hypothetical protein TFLX_01286 [Thermoflexales bacterium]
MLESFWWLMNLSGIESVIPIPLMISIIVGWIVYGLQKSSLRDDEARQRATTLALVFFVVLTFISCWLFYAANPGSIFL